MSRGVYCLSDVPAGERVAVICRRCDRRAEYPVSHLIAEMGEDMPMPSVLAELTSLWCRGRNSWGQCAATYEDPLGLRDPPVVPGARLAP